MCVCVRRGGSPYELTFGVDGNKLMEDAVFTLWTWLKNFEKDFALTYSYWSSNIASGFVFSGG